MNIDYGRMHAMGKMKVRPPDAREEYCEGAVSVWDIHQPLHTIVYQQERKYVQTYSPLEA